jgi:phage terminase small subunit
MAASEAYLWAAYKGNARSAAASANRLQKNANIRARIDALLLRRQQIDAEATKIAVEKLAITKERVLAELAKIGFADLRKAVRWHGALIKEEANAEGDALVVKTTYSNHVELISSKELDDDIADAIAEVSQTQHGVKIELHDKRAALVDIGKHLGMFVERSETVNVNYTISDSPSEVEWADAFVTQH